MKRGWLTSEFWLTVATNIVALAVLLGFLSAEESQLIRDQLVQVVALGAPFLTALVSLVMYIWSRTQVKKEMGKTTILAEVAKDVEFNHDDETLLTTSTFSLSRTGRSERASYSIT